MTVSPAVSIIMPCFNAASFLQDSIGSVLSQTFSDWELITLDDGSTDTTWQRLGDYHDEPRIRAFTHPNQGVSRTRNRGIQLARGRYLAFLDSDDTWAPEFLSHMSALLKGNDRAVLAYCGWQNLGLPGGCGQPYVPPDYEQMDKEAELFSRCGWPIHAALVRRDALLATGGFAPDLTNAEDYLLWLTLASVNPIVRLPEVLAFYHFHCGPQASSQRNRAALQLQQAQLRYLQQRPNFRARLGRTRIREIMLGSMLQEAFDSYWRRDLTTARALFRRVMAAGYGHRRDWRYMIPALLPISLHKALISFLEQRPKPTGSDSS